jgi:hypothetical protein
MQGNEPYPNFVGYGGFLDEPHCRKKGEDDNERV